MKLMIWFAIILLLMAAMIGCSIERKIGDYTGKVFFTVEDVLYLYGEMTNRGGGPFKYETQNGYKVGVETPAEVILDREEVERLMNAVKGSRGFVHFTTRRGREIEVTSAFWE